MTTTCEQLREREHVADVSGHALADRLVAQIQAIPRLPEFDPEAKRVALSLIEIATLDELRKLAE
jgi:hypothetical protein